MDKTVDISQLSSLEQFTTRFSNLSDDYVFSHFRAAEGPKGAPAGMLSGPLRLDGHSLLLCFEGEIELEINLQPMKLGPDTLFWTTPGSIVEIKNVGRGPIDWYGLFISSAFLEEINFDLNVISSVPMGESGERRNVYQLNPSEMAQLRHYFDILHYNSSKPASPDDAPARTVNFAKPIARSLFAALIYEMMQMIFAHLNREPSLTQGSSRRITYVHNFLNLVHRYHREQRSVAFYADKLFISPKYLSLIVKEQTGRSAARIIDSFVVLEAKSMLRFSGKNIQEVAYELNFPNQSSFGKFFKNLTGMSPSDYQKSW